MLTFLFIYSLIKCKNNYNYFYVYCLHLFVCMDSHERKSYFVNFIKVCWLYLILWINLPSCIFTYDVFLEHLFAHMPEKFYIWIRRCHFLLTLNNVGIQLIPMKIMSHLSQIFSYLQLIILTNFISGFQHSRIMKITLIIIISYFAQAYEWSIALTWPCYKFCYRLYYSKNRKSINLTMLKIDVHDKILRRVQQSER